MVITLFYRLYDLVENWKVKIKNKKAVKLPAIKK